MPGATWSAARSTVNVAKNRFGLPGRQTEIEIRYLADGEHATALERYATARQPVAADATDHSFELRTAIA